MKKFLVIVAVLLSLTSCARPTELLMPACETEDSTGCYWNAEKHGNGEGRSFYTSSSGNVKHYTSN